MISGAAFLSDLQRTAFLLGVVGGLLLYTTVKLAQTEWGQAPKNSPTKGLLGFTITLAITLVLTLPASFLHCRDSSQFTEAASTSRKHVRLYWWWVVCLENFY